MTVSAAVDEPGHRRLRHARSVAVLAPDATVTSWSAHDEGLPPLVTPAHPGSGVGFVGVRAHRAWTAAGARTQIVAACGIVEVWDQLRECAEPVGRAAPGVALARRVRCLDGPLDVAHRVSLAPTHMQDPVAWRPLNRIVFGYSGDRRVTVDGGEGHVRGDAVTSRLTAGPGIWTVLTVAFDGHLPAGDAAAAWWPSG